MLIRIKRLVFRTRFLTRHLGIMGALRFRIAEILRRPEHQVTLRGIPLWVRPRTPDLWVAVESLGDEFECLAEHLDQGFDGVVIDARAYIGSAALKLSTMFPRATVVCIEASQDNFGVLKRNVGTDGKIDVIHAALAAHSGETVSLRDRGTGQWGFTIIEQPDDNPMAAIVDKVETISISDIAARYPGRGIGLIKIDIEGGEKLLFEKGIKELGDIPVVFAELHDRIVDGCTKAFESFSKDREVLSFGGEKFLSRKKSARVSE